MDGAESAVTEGAPPIFHVHPSLRCNLACGHCYSSSSPRARDALPLDVLLAAIDDAAALGFGVLSVSGGEPLMYAGLVALLERAKRHGMRTQIATNGWFLGGAAMRAAAPHLDLVAVSLDGPADLHNAVRGSPRAHDRLVAGLPVLRGLGLRFGVIHTVTRASWEHLFEVAEFAADAGACLLQLHPVEQAGRAVVPGVVDWALDETTLARTYVVAALLKSQYAGSMHVQIDLLPRTHLPQPCNVVDAARAFGIVVLEADGVVVPLAHGFDRRFALADLTRGRIAEAWPAASARVLPQYRTVMRGLRDELDRPDAPELCNWHERMLAASVAHVF